MSDERIEHTAPQYMEDDEITLKELILKLKEFWKEIWRYWYLVILFSIPFVAFFGYQAYISPVVFPASITFITNEAGGGGLQIGGLLSSFGLGGRKGGSNIFLIDRLAKSDLVLKKTLLQKVEIKGEEDFLANHILKEYEIFEELKEKFKPKEETPEWKLNLFSKEIFLFQDADYFSFEEMENWMLNQVKANLIGDNEGKIDPIVTLGMDEDLGTQTIASNATDPDLSLTTSNTLYTILIESFEDVKIASDERNFNIIQQKADSIEQALNTAEYNLAKFEDTHRSIEWLEGKVRQMRMQRDVTAGQLMLAEIAKQKELIDYSLKANRPIFQVLDASVKPIRKTKEKSLVKSVLIGGFLGGFLAVIYIIGRKVIRDAMREES